MMHCELPISFDPRFSANEAFGVSFVATLDGLTVASSVSSEALPDINSSNAQGRPQEQLMAHRADIESIAARKILAGEEQPIRITSADVRA
jgi:hypothetical protein